MSNAKYNNRAIIKSDGSKSFNLCVKHCKSESSVLALNLGPFRWVKYSPIFESNLAPVNQRQYSPITKEFFEPEGWNGPQGGLK